MSDSYGKVEKYEVYENFFLVSVTGSSKGVEAMKERAKRSMEEVRKRRARAKENECKSCKRCPSLCH